MIADIVTGVVVNVITAAGQRLGTAAATLLRGRRHGDDVAIARWFETYRLTKEAPALPELSGEQSGELAVILGGDEVQAVLHELLAARLTNAPEVEVRRVWEIWALTVGASKPDISPIAEILFRYYDEEICELVSRLERWQPVILDQIRNEAFSTRIVATLNAIERHTAALMARPDWRTETDFLTRYRRHVSEYHGNLEPPDFERRRRVPIADLYVPPSIIQVVEADPRDPPIDIRALIH